MTEQHMPDGGILSTATTPIMGREQWATVAGDKIVVGVSDQFELRVYGSDGQLERLIRAPFLDRAATAEEWREAIEEEIESRDAATNPRRAVEALAELVPAPDVRPAFSGLIGDSEGYVWVRPYLPTRGQPAAWTVVDPKGQLLGTVDLPEGFSPTEIGQDYLLGTSRDEMGVEYVHMYRLNR